MSRTSWICVGLILFRLTVISSGPVFAAIVFCKQVLLHRDSAGFTDRHLKQFGVKGHMGDIFKYY